MSTPRPNLPHSGAEPVGADRLGAMLELSPFPALLVEVDTGRVVAANEAAVRLYLAPADATKADVCAADAAGARLEARQVVPHLLAHPDRAEGVEIAWQTPGRRYSLRAFVRIRPAAEGEPRLAVLTFLDVTREKETEEELRQALAGRDELVSIAAHELKDPLFALKLSLQFLRHSAERQGAIPAPLSHHLEVSERQADRMGRLIENLLDLSRLANDRLRPDLRPVDLRALAADLASRLQARARAAGSVLVVEKGEPVSGAFDPVMMEQVLGNLLTNAIKYGAGAPITVRFRGDEQAVRLEVEDRGPGIPAEDQQRIFNRFERASSGHRKESLGLGLYITRALVAAHGGTVAVRSAPGRGATFVVTLPRRPAGHSPTPKE